MRPVYSAHMQHRASLRTLKDPLFIVFLTMFLILFILFPWKMRNSILSFPLHTFIALFTLMLVTEGMKESGYFSEISLKILKKFTSERNMALFLVTLSAGLSTFLTNDVALFITIPLTLAVLSQVRKDLSKLIVFNAIAVNVGSALTPIGNPQNLYLWHQWGIPFWEFIYLMVPPVVISLFLLFIFVFISFPSGEMKIKILSTSKVDRKKFLVFLLFLFLFIIIMQTNFEYCASLIILVTSLIFFQRILKKVDYILLLIFALIFLDFDALPMILNLPATSHSASDVYVLSILLSQVMSNVPATVFLSHLTSHRVALAWGANIGGNGLLIASLANMLALRLSRRKILYEFHKYSVPFLVLTFLCVYLLFLL